MDRQAISPDTTHKHSRLRGATKSHSVCPYCSVGCSQNVYTKGGEVIDIEGDPESPINEGTLCPKGANTFQLVSNPHRVSRVMYRAPYSDHWEQRPLDWAMDRIAHLVKDTRDRDFIETSPDGMEVNHLKTIAHLGGATLDNEENYLIKKFFTGGLGILAVENQARIRPAPRCLVWAPPAPPGGCRTRAGCAREPVAKRARIWRMPSACSACATEPFCSSAGPCPAWAVRRSGCHGRIQLQEATVAAQHPLQRRER